jgi:hypothetical protein
MNKSQYKPDYTAHVEIIRRDLNLPDDIDIQVQFRSRMPKWRYGDISYYPLLNKAIIRIYTLQPKSEMLRTLMHELRHVKQYVDGTLRDISYHALEWDGRLYKTNKLNIYQINELPWEIDARTYENTVDTLFPNAIVPRTLIGITSGGTKFYKIP